MHLLFMFVLLFVGSPSIAPSTNEKPIVGVYVNKESFYRIEFCDDGDYYERNAPRGTYEIIQGEIHCKPLGSSIPHLKFRIDGECLTDTDNERWIPRGKILNYPWKERIPYTVRFQDKVTGEPLTDLRVNYEIDNPSGQFDTLTARGLEINEDGTMVIDAPQSCSIYLELYAEYIKSSNDHERLIVRTSDIKRSKIVQVERGQSVSGIVVHADTRQPVPNARITPNAFGIQRNYSSSKKAILSDKNGRFHLQGVDEECGFNVEHPSFRTILEKRLPNGERAEGVVIELIPGDSLRGTVRNQLGQPLKDVDVSIPYQEPTTTDEEGNFELHGLDLSSKKIVSFSSDDYQSVERAIKGIDEISITMSPKPKLKIEVPLEYVREGMKLSAGPCSEQNEDPLYFECISKKVDSENRELVLFFDNAEELESCKEIWVGTKAPGLALWETHLSVSSRSVDEKLIVQPKFTKGFSILGRIKAVAVEKENAKENRIRVKVIPVENQSSKIDDISSQRVVMGTLETEVDDQGSFEFKNALPGEYALEIQGYRPTTYRRKIVVAKTDLRLGDIEIKKGGTLRGSIKFPAEKQEDFIFRWCEVSYHPTWFESLSAQFRDAKPAPWKPFEIMTDENGDFVVENVPAGEVQVSLTEFMGCFSFTRTAVTTVRDGKTSTVVIDKTD